MLLRPRARVNRQSAHRSAFPSRSAGHSRKGWVHDLSDHGSLGVIQTQTCDDLPQRVVILFGPPKRSLEGSEAGFGTVCFVSSRHVSDRLPQPFHAPFLALPLPAHTAPFSVDGNARSSPLSPPSWAVSGLNRESNR